MLFGCHVYNYGPASGVEAISRIGRKAEELRLASVFVSDHIVIPEVHTGIFGDTFFDPLVALSYLAGCTSSVRLGTSVLILPYRNPLVTAKMVSTLDALSGGRVTLGVGVGWAQEEFDILKQPFHERGKMTDEYIRIMREVWTNESPSYQGDFWQFKDIRVLPHPVQKPHPPILIGGTSRAALRRVARLGDGWLPNRVSPEEIKADWHLVRRLAERAGRDPDILKIHVRQPLVFLDEPRIPHVPFVGTPEELTVDIRSYHEVGVEEIIFDFHLEHYGTAYWDVEGVLRALERFDNEVRPLVADIEG